MNPITREILEKIACVLQFSDKEAILLCYKIISKTVAGVEVETKKKHIKIKDIEEIK